jgi:hypothetical protein
VAVPTRNALQLGANGPPQALGDPVFRLHVMDRERNKPLRAAACTTNPMVRVRPSHASILQRSPSDVSMVSSLRGEPGQGRDQSEKRCQHQGADDRPADGEEPHQRRREDRDLPCELQREPERDRRTRDRSDDCRPRPVEE